MILGILSLDKRIAVKRFRNFNEEQNEDKCLNDDKVIKLRDEEAKPEVKKIIGGYNIAEIKSLPKYQRDEII